jgi:hypothetical protein
VNRAHIGIFLKEPRPDRVKTRLAKAIGAEAAAALYTAMLGDTVTLARRAGASSELYFYEGAWPGAFLPEILDGASLTIEQRGEGLGARLAGATRAAADAGRLPILFLGSDSPDLPLSHLRGALTALADHDVVLGPSADGGAWCIGLRLAIEGFFDDLPWSAAETFEALVARGRALHLTIAEAPSWSDVDELSDLLALEERVRQNPNQAPRCRAWLVENAYRLVEANPNL